MCVRVGEGQGGRRSSVHSLEGRDGLKLLCVQRVLVDRAILQIHTATLVVDLRQGVLHPVLIIALLCVFVYMCVSV